MGDEMAFRMRASKYRHVFGSPAKKEHCYESIKITKNAHDSNFCAVNPKFIAIVTESAGGGSFLVLPIEKVGRVDINCAKVCGHSGPVLDIKWNPFNDHIIASCSDDATVKLWQIPDNGLRANLTEWLVDLHGHQRRVGFLEWHPTAENILLSAGYDFKCILWNTETAEPINIISVHTDTIFSISWNRDGSLFASTCKDKKIRIIDPRQGTVVAEGPGHQGSKASKVVFLGDRNLLFTTGFSRMSERQFSVWDAKKLSSPLKTDIIDSSSGVMFPYYDVDTRVVFLAGKGDGNVRYYEITDEQPYVHYLNQYQSSSPQRGLGVMPKRGVDPSRCEIMRLYKLHAVKGICEPVSMIVPRKSEMFQEDIFPPTASASPSLSADEWISGLNRDPILVSMKSKQTLTPPRKRSGQPVRPQDGAISNSPTITTYKAVKRSTSNISTTVSSGQDRLKRQATAPPTATVAPVSPSKLPASVRNIRKLSVAEEDEHMLNNNRSEVKENINDMINSFERKTNIVTQSTTRMTNANEAVHVDKKVWSSSYAGNNYSNGVAPQTDPELPPSSPRSPQMQPSSPRTPNVQSSPRSPYMSPQASHTSRTSLQSPQPTSPRTSQPTSPNPPHHHEMQQRATYTPQMAQRRGLQNDARQSPEPQRLAVQYDDSFNIATPPGWSQTANEEVDDSDIDMLEQNASIVCNQRGPAQAGRFYGRWPSTSEADDPDLSLDEIVMNNRNIAHCHRTTSLISDSDASENFCTPPTSPMDSPIRRMPGGNHYQSSSAAGRLNHSTLQTPGGSQAQWQTNRAYASPQTSSLSVTVTQTANVKQARWQNSPRAVTLPEPASPRSPRSHEKTSGAGRVSNWQGSPTRVGTERATSSPESSSTISLSHSQWQSTSTSSPDSSPQLNNRSTFHTPAGSQAHWQSNPIYQDENKVSSRVFVIGKPRPEMEKMESEGLVRNSPFRRSLQTVRKSQQPDPGFVRNTPLRRSAQAVTRTEQTESTFVRSSPMRRSLQAYTRTEQNSQSDPGFPRQSSLRRNGSFRSQSSVSTPDTAPDESRVPEENYNPSIGRSLTSSSSSPAVNQGDDSYIDMNAFPTDAPDNTLIKPSKLRESIRRGRMRRGHSNPEPPTSTKEDTNNNYESKPRQEVSPQSRSRIPSREASPGKPHDAHTGPSSRNIMYIERLQTSSSHHSMPHESSSPVTSPPKSPAPPARSPERTASPPPVTNGHADSRVPSTDEAAPAEEPVVKTKSLAKLREARRDRRARMASDPQADRSRVQVKQVWSTEARPSSASPPASATNGLPDTDPELRKAYFQQLEEIRSLKEQISLKDKRIRQLEEEVNTLREMSGLEESTC